MLCRRGCSVTNLLHSTPLDGWIELHPSPALSSVLNVTAYIIMFVQIIVKSV